MKSINSHSESDASLTALFAGTRTTIFVASCVINVLALAFPLLMLQLYDRILPYRSQETLLLLAITVLLAILIESLLRGVRSYITAWVAARFEHRAMNAVVNRALAEPLHCFEKKGTGFLMDRFRSITTLKYHYSGQAFQQLLDLPFTILYVLIAALINFWIGVLLLSGYAIFVVITAVRSRGFPELVKQQKEVDARRGNFLNETLTNIHTVKSMTMESLMLRRYERLQEACARALSRLAYRLDMSAGLGSVFSPLMTLLTVGLGALLVINGQMTNGELAACVLLGMRALAPLQRLGGLWSKFQQDKVLRAQLMEVLHEPKLPESRDSVREHNHVTKSHADTLKQGGHLEVRGVRYQFPSVEKPIFENLSLEVQPGECVLLSGASGSGCTTLLRMIAGVLAPNQGEILIDGEPLVVGQDRSNTTRLAYLPETSWMFEGSLIENISLFDPTRVDRAIETAKRIGLGAFVSRLPRGWDSIVGDMAVDSLPPGYRQRLAIVRALSIDPNVILFDEATGNIDIEGDSLFLKYLASIKGQVTILIVSNRPSFQSLADRKLYISDGQITAIAPEATTQRNSDIRTPAERPDMTPVTAQLKPTIELTHQLTVDQLGGRWHHMAETVTSQFKTTSDLAECFTVLLQLMNARQTAREVAEALPYYTESLDLTGFNNAMAQLGYRVIEAPCTLGSLDARSLPCLFVPDQGMAFVVIGRIGPELRVNTSFSSEPRLESNMSMQGRAFFYEPIESLSIDPRGWVHWVLTRFRPLVGQATISSLVSGFLMVASPLFLIAVYSKVIPTGAADTLLYLTLGALFAVSACYFFVEHRARVLSYIAGRVEYLFGVTILQQILRMSPAYTERASVGSQSARIRSFEAVRDMFTGPLLSTFLELPATLVLLVALSVINPIALLVFILMLGAYFVLYRIFVGPSRQRVAAVSQTFMARNQFLVEMIGKMRAIRECSGQRVWLERFRAISASATMASFQAEQLAAAMTAVSYFVMMLAALTIVTVSVPAVWADAIASGALIASMILMWRVLSPVQTVFTNMTRLERVNEAVKQIDSLMKIQGERPDSVMVANARSVQGGLEFARVSFRYSLNTDPALIGVEFFIKPGQVVAISGPNGGGKSTLLKLILGMYQPQAGAILLDNTDVRQLDPLELRRLVAYAPQEVQLFRATLLQNLRMARPDATEAQVWEALRMAGAVEQISALPKGIEYRVGDNTNELGASLLQKLSLARAYLTQAPVLLIDESAAALDATGEQAFVRTLKDLKGKRTVLFITHRPSHMQLADVLLIFDKGYLRASGPPDKLLKQVTAA